MGIFGKPNVEKLRTSGDAKGWHKLLVSPGSSDELVTEAAVALLDLDATDQLRDALLSKLGVDQVGQLANAFVAHGNAKAGPFLLSLWLEGPRDAAGLDDYARWQREKDFRRLVIDRIRPALVTMPGAWLDGQTTAALIRVLQDKTPSRSSDRTLAAQCLTGVRDADVVAALAACLHDPFSDVRLAAAEALKESADPEVKAALLALLRDEEPKVRAAVSGAVEEDVVSDLLAGLRDESASSRRAAIQSLSGSGSAEAIEPIADLLTDPDPSVRSTAAHALAGFGDRRGLDILIAETENADWEERARAIASLGQTGAAEAVPTLVGVLHDTSFHVKEVAAQSLAELGWEPTMDEEGAYYFLARNEAKQCLRIGAKATEPLLDYLSALDEKCKPHIGIGIAGELLWGRLRSYSLIEVTGEIADSRVVPVLQDLLEKEMVEAHDAGDHYLEPLARAIASCDAAGRNPAVASMEEEHSDEGMTSIRPDRSLDEVADEIVAIEGQIDKVAQGVGKGKDDPEWSRCDDRLTAIGEELYAEGGEARMRAALEGAYRRGMSGRYVDRHWTGIGGWMG